MAEYTWQIKLRMLGEKEHEIADIRLQQRTAPVVGDLIDVVVKRKAISARIVQVHKPRRGVEGRYVVSADQVEAPKPAS